jgi:hypothetical protein
MHRILAHEWLIPRGPLREFLAQGFNWTFRPNSHRDFPGALRISASSYIHQTWEFSPELLHNFGELIAGGWARFKFEHEISMESRCDFSLKHFDYSAQVRTSH